MAKAKHFKKSSQDWYSHYAKEGTQCSFCTTQATGSIFTEGLSSAEWVSSLIAMQQQCPQ